jgi:hypothetical protein
MFKPSINSSPGPGVRKSRKTVFQPDGYLDHFDERTIASMKTNPRTFCSCRRA